MARSEAEAWLLNTIQQNWYKQLIEATSVRRPTNSRPKTFSSSPALPWEMSRQGILKHLLNEKKRNHVEPFDACIQFIPPNSRSGKHRHIGEEWFYVIDGNGYVEYQDCDIEIADTYRWKDDDEVKYFEWQAGDVIYIPPNTLHQHFSTDRHSPARILSVISCTYQKFGLNDTKQLEDAPEYEPGIVLTDELVMRYMNNSEQAVAVSECAF
jgi:quercetin dioxygenase-like cupin family protein